MEFRQALKADFRINHTYRPFGETSIAWATNERGEGFEAKFIVGHNPNFYWATADSVTSASLEIIIGDKESISRLVLKENIRLGQQVSSFKIFAWQNEEWTPIAEGTTIGYKRILRFAKIETTRLKIEFEGNEPLAFNEVGIY